MNFFPAQKKEQKLEVSYMKNNSEVKVSLNKEVPRKELSSRTFTSRVISKKIAPPPFIDKEGIFKRGNEIASSRTTFNKPAFVKSDIISVKKIITLPPLDLDKISNPSYISYYQIVREKIRRAAYQNYNRTEEGDIYLSFVIQKGGLLKEVRFIEEKSSPNQYLKEIALKSIKDASSFPVFPKELDYPELSFNVIISFKVE